MSGKDIATLCEVLGKMMAQQNQQFAAFMAEMANTGPGQSTPMVDTRGMGRPPSFSGLDKEWREWKGKLTAYLYATAPHAKPFLDWAEASMSPISQELMEIQCTNDQGNVATDALNNMAQFSTRLGLILVDTCKGEPYRLVESA